MRFSVKRMLWAFAVWSGVFALLHSEMPARNIAALVVATSCAAVVLLAQREHIIPIVAISLGAVVGVAAVWSLMPGYVGRNLEAAERANLIWTCLGALGGSLLMRIVSCLDPMLRKRESSGDVALAEE